jgi:hypothetical protein
MTQIITTASTKHCLLKIDQVLQLKQSLKKDGEPVPKFLCSHCMRPVRPLKKSDTTAAHFEHLKRNIQCPLSEKSKAKQLYAKRQDEKAERRLAAKKNKAKA